MSDASRRPPPTWADVLGLAGLAAFAGVQLLPPVVLGLVGALLALSTVRPSREAGRFSRPARAVLGGLCLIFALRGEWLVWPIYWLLPVLGALLLAVAADYRREALAALTPGRLGRSEWALVGVIAVLAGVALVGWTVILQPDLSRAQSMLPPWPLPALIAAGLGFSVLNAVLEEVIWRGWLLRWLHGFLPGALAVLVQAASFGAAHYAGFPSGWVGMGLAGIYGLMIGALALRSKGLLAPIVAHVFADAVIFSLLASRL